MFPDKALCGVWLYTGATLVLPKEDFYQSIGEVSHVSLVPTQLQRWFDYLAEHPQSIQTQAVYWVEHKSL